MISNNYTPQQETNDSQQPRKREAKTKATNKKNRAETEPWRRWHEAWHGEEEDDNADYWRAKHEYEYNQNYGNQYEEEEAGDYYDPEDYYDNWSEESVGVWEGGLRLYC